MSIATDLELGRRAHQGNDYARAAQLFRQVVQADPHHGEAWRLLGEACLFQGAFAEAAQSYQQSLQLQSGRADTHGNLGVALLRLGRLEEAVTHYREALRQQPANAGALNNLGVALTELDRLDEAAIQLRQALAVQPTYAQAHNALGNVLGRQGQLHEAAASYRRALQLQPHYLLAQTNLAGVLLRQGQVEEAVRAYQQVLSQRPNDPEALNGLKAALQEQGKRDEAPATSPPTPQPRSDPSDLAEAYRTKGFELDAQGYNGRGIALLRQDQLGGAEEHLRQAVKLKPDFAEAHNNLGYALMRQGQIDQALTHYREAHRLNPQDRTAYHNILLGLNYDPEADPVAVFEDHCRWGQLHGQAPFPAVHTNVPSPERRLRIGYVSPDFRQHALCRYIEPILAHHDPAQVEIICYAEVSAPDAMTARLQALGHGWRWTWDKSAAQVAEAVRADGIDILVDLAGHTAGNRLDVFALKPAPIQATWLGYPNTTGLRTIDYRLTDAVMDPHGQAVLDTEELFRLPGCCYPFMPPHDAPGIAPLPAQRRGYLTFGSPHNLAKLNARVFDLWCRVLKAVPTARLRMFRNTLTGKAREFIHRQFTERGIVGDRLELRQGWSGPGYLEVYGEIDVSLDVFPYSGAVTTLESLWMGAPMLTLPGARPASRASAAILTRIGLTDWIAPTPEEFVARALQAAHDLDRLTQLRSSLRERMRSTVCDNRQFARAVEDAYRTMWRRWCAEGRSHRQEARLR